MILINATSFRMGSDRFYPEEAPARSISVETFRIDETPVTNADYAEFVAATGYVTIAETAPSREDYPDALPHMLRAGSLVFVPPPYPVSLTGPVTWWQFVFGANWRHPEGPDSSLTGRDLHPVVHIAYADAEAYAAWAGKSLPTEAQWEAAARGGSDAEFAWGDELAPAGQILANYWIGEFPSHNRSPAGQERTTPVGSFPPNGFGLYDMIGNAWEWTSDWYGSRSRPAPGCCGGTDPRGATETESLAPGDPGRPIGRKVLKGGSHLCAENYCRRFRPAARYPQPIDTSTSHVGFRCVQGTSQELK